MWVDGKLIGDDHSDLSGTCPCDSAAFERRPEAKTRLTRTWVSVVVTTWLETLAFGCKVERRKATAWAQSVASKKGADLVWQTRQTRNKCGWFNAPCGCELTRSGILTLLVRYNLVAARLWLGHMQETRQHTTYRGPFLSNAPFLCNAPCNTLYIFHLCSMSPCLIVKTTYFIVRMESPIQMWAMLEQWKKC